ncbi:glutathione S-transferase family protein [Ancylobacter aquaticus]|nr:glutathione S-transferase family protein [Ancylobacter aquaticus]
MIVLYSYPPLFNAADNNGYGLKIFAYLRLAGLPFEHRHVVDASSAPRGQLPYILDEGEVIGDSETIIAHLESRQGAALDAGLTRAQRDTALLVTRMLDDLYWVMSYSRWKDPAFWPAFQAAMQREHPELTDTLLQQAHEYNAQRYHFQGIGRYEPHDAYARGLADLAVLARLLPAEGYAFGPTPTSVDAAIYGFIANILFSDIETPLRRFTVGQPNLVRHCEGIHAAITPLPTQVT